MYIRKLVAVLMAMMILCLAAPAAMAESSSTWDRVKTVGSDLWDKTKEKAPEVWDKTKDKASELYGKAREKAPEVKKKVKDSVSNAQEKISDFNNDQQDQFWQWFDGQTGGTTNVAPSTDDNHNPNGNLEYESNPNQNPEYVPGPDSTTGGAAAGNNAQQDAPSASQPAAGGVPDEVLDKYGQDGVYYYDPNEGKARPVSGELPETITVNGQIYQHVPEDSVEAQQPSGREYDEIVIDGRIYRRYLTDDAQTASQENPADGNWGMAGVCAAVVAGGLVLMALIWGLASFNARESVVKERARRSNRHSE